MIISPVHCLLISAKRLPHSYFLIRNPDFAQALHPCFLYRALPPGINMIVLFLTKNIFTYRSY
jgi:hypothetical protein